VGIGIWKKCLQSLEDELSAQQFNTCIKPLQVVTGNTEVKLLAPNKYIRDQINDQFLHRITELVRMNGPQQVRLEIGSTQKLRREGNAFVERESFYPLLDLNKEFTFDTFVEGRSNQIARAAALQVSENIGGASYNPLLLYGGVG
jgi:chromosomal replication initiator protein